MYETMRTEQCITYTNTAFTYILQNTYLTYMLSWPWFSRFREDHQSVTSITGLPEAEDCTWVLGYPHTCRHFNARPWRQAPVPWQTPWWYPRTSSLVHWKSTLYLVMLVSWIHGTSTRDVVRDVRVESLFLICFRWISVRLFNMIVVIRSVSTIGLNPVLRLMSGMPSTMMVSDVFTCRL